MIKTNGDVRHPIGSSHIVTANESSVAVITTATTTKSLATTTTTSGEAKYNNSSAVIVPAVHQQQQQQRRPQRLQQPTEEEFAVADGGTKTTAAVKSCGSSHKTIATSPVHSEPLGSSGWEHDFAYPATRPAKPRTKIIYDLGTPEMNSQGRWMARRIFRASASENEAYLHMHAHDILHVLYHLD
jgi:hypothetical protein